MKTRLALTSSISSLAPPLAAFFAVFLLATPSSISVPKDWVGPNPDNDWFTPTNWSPNGAPAVTDITTIENGTAASIGAPGAFSETLFLGNADTGTLNVSGTGELTAGGNVFVGFGAPGTLNITGGGTVRHPTFDGVIGNSSGIMGVATVDGASHWLLHNLTIGEFGNGTLNILNGGTVTGFDAFIGEFAGSTGLAVIDGAGGPSTLQLGAGNFFVGGNGIAVGGTGVLRVLHSGIVNSNRLVVLSTGTLEIGENPQITVTNPLGIEYVHGTLKTIADTTFTNNGSLQNGGVIVDSNGFNSTLSGVYSGTGDVTKIGAGTITLTGDNTYSDATMVDGGILAVGHPNALGTGNVFVQGLSSDSTLRTAGNTVLEFNVHNSFFLYGGSPTTTLEMKVGGTTGALTSDLMQVTNDAHLDFTNTGTSMLFVRRIDGVMPAPGDRTRIINTWAGTVMGEFGEVQSDFPGLIQPTAEYTSNTVDVVFQLSPFTSLSGLTPNQESVAVALDEAFSDECLSLETFAFLGSIPTNLLPEALDLIAPEEMAAIYTMSFSYATVRNENLIRRMEDIRVGSGGYCPVVVEVPTGKDYNDKNVAGDKNVAPPVVMETRECTWGFFLNGTGDFATVDSDFNAHGYDTETGSLIAGADYRIGKHFAIGIDGGYVGGDADLADEGRIQLVGGRIGGYATVFGTLFGAKVHLDGAVDGGWNKYDTNRTVLSQSFPSENTGAQGDTEGDELNAMVSYGGDWSFGCLHLGTWSTLQYTKVDIDGFEEHGSLIPLHFPGQDEESIRTTTGVKASYDWKFGRAIFRPEARIAWFHEYGDSAVDIKANFIDCPTTFTVHGPKLGDDAALVGGGFSVQWNGCLSTYVYYDGVLFRDNYQSNAVSGGVRFGF